MCRVIVVTSSQYGVPTKVLSGCILVSCTLRFQDSPEFDLVFDNAVDQWVASSSAEKCIFVQILYHACQTYWTGKAADMGKTGKLGKMGHKGSASQGTHDEVRAGPSGSSPRSASRTLQARRKSYIPPKQTEFINCQSKLTRGSATSWSLVNMWMTRCLMTWPCSFRCLHHESGLLSLQSLLEPYEEKDGCKSNPISRSR